MKKLIYILFLLPFLSIGQSQPQDFDYGIRNNDAPTVSTSDFIVTSSSTGIYNKIKGENISLSVIPPVTHFVPLSASIKGYFQGVDDAIGNISATTAGSTTRLWYTADQTTITAGTFFKTNFLGKGIIASAQQDVVNGDNEKKYFAQDLIGETYITTTTFPKGVYAANLSVSTSPNSANQRFTIEIYKCNTNGIPIASGVTDAVVGDLGVTVIGILDSGLLTLANASITNIALSTTINYPFTINVGERVRYHISAAKVGTDAANITESVYYGTSYNSYIDIPVPLNTDNITNLSTVTGTTVTAALDNLKNSIPTSFTQIVYVNATNPNAATIFDLNNPPVTNNNALKADVTNLYVGTDASNWVYNSTTMLYVTKAVVGNSNFNFAGTNISADGNKTGAIERTGTVGGAQGTAANHFVTKAQLDTKISGVGINGQISFWNGTNSQSGDNWLFWDNTNKRLGIGTTTPTEKLDVVGAGRFVTTNLGVAEGTTDYYVAKPLGSIGDFATSVILLHPVYNGTLITHYECNGTITVRRGGTNSGLNTGSISINSSTAYSVNTYNVSYVNTNSNFYKLVTCDFGGVKYLALRADLSSDASGRSFFFDGYSQGNSDALQIKAIGAVTNVVAVSSNGQRELEGLTVSGNITTSPAVSPNQVVVKSQLDAVGRPYKVYTALISQTGTNAPTVTILENTLGFVPTPAYTGVGGYTFNSINAYTVGKTSCMVGSGNGAILDSKVITYNPNSSQLFVTTTNASGTTLLNGILNNTLLEIRIYP